MSDDALALAAAISRGDVTATEAVEAAIERIQERNPSVNAVIGTCFDEARAAVDRGLPEGPFRGVPFLIKALGVAVEGMAVTRGSRLFADDVTPHDSELVARYRRSGLVILGLTNTPELGRTTTTEPFLHGATRNPRSPEHSPGGSSGGSAAAVASGMVPAAHGSDGGGSIRIPASACGLFGLKPSRGRVPNHPGLGAFASPISCHHALTTTVRDSAALLDAVAGPAAGDPYWAPLPDRPFLHEVGADPGKLRIAVTLEAAKGIDVHPDMAAAVDHMAGVLSGLGHDVKRSTPTIDRRMAGRIIGMLMSTNTVSQVDKRLAALERELADDDLEPIVRSQYFAAKAAYAEHLATALENAEVLCRQSAADFADVDLWLMPTMAAPTPKLGYLNGNDVEGITKVLPFSTFTGVFNVTGQPAMSVPCGVDSRRRPVGVQFAARFGDEATLLRVAAQLERAEPWPTAPTWPV
ncbi:MAG: amidase [Acidimicrobiia bacterium]